MTKRPWASRLMMSGRTDSPFSESQTSWVIRSVCPMNKRLTESIRLKEQLSQLHRRTHVTDQYTLLERNANLARPPQICHPKYT